MITPEQFSEMWGPGLVRTEPAAVVGVNIPEAARRFLTEAGLPAQADYDIRFSRPEDELPTLPEAFPNGYSFPPEYNHFHPIGVDGTTLLCLEEATGFVYSIDIDEQGIPTRLVNSGIPELAECLLVNRVTSQEDEDEDKDEDEASQLLIQALEKKMQCIDPLAMHDPNNYWPQFFRAALL